MGIFCVISYDHVYMGSTLSLGVFTVAHTVVDVLHVTYGKYQKVGRFRRKINRFVEKNVTRKFDGLNKRHRTITYVSFSLIQGVKIISNYSKFSRKFRTELGAENGDLTVNQR